jgi:hypothetical protein
MRGIWFLLTGVCVFAIAGMLFIWGRTERFDAELEAKIRELKGTQEYKDAVGKLDEIRAKVAATADRGAKSLETALQKLKAEADPKVAQAKADLERLLQELSKELAILQAKAEMAARDLERELARLTTEGRRKAVEGLEWARAEAEKLEVKVVQVAAGVQTAAVEQGDKAAKALEKQKRKLQEQLKSVDALKEKLLPPGEER